MAEQEHRHALCARGPRRKAQEKFHEEIQSTLNFVIVSERREAQ
jgi:hypothetical protein